MKKLLAGLLLALLSSSVIAETIASVGGGEQSINGSKFGIAYFGLGYQFETGSEWSFVPEVRYDIGWSSGIGFGAGYQLVRRVSVEASVERVSGADFF